MGARHPVVPATTNTEPSNIRMRQRLQRFNGLQELDDEVRARSDQRATRAPRIDQDARNGRVYATAEETIVGERVAVVALRLRARVGLLFGTCRRAHEEDR